jgi:reverse transcriptase-like protein
MTTAQAVGAVSRKVAEWYAMDWQAINHNVRRLQVRIVQATKASRWGKVRALQHLLTHSYSGKVLAVRRVTENMARKPLAWTKKSGTHQKRRYRLYINSSAGAINLSLFDVFTSRNRTAKRCARSEFPL